MFFFANPLGLWVLAGLPVIIALHMLRLKTRVIPVSTLFLIERALPTNEGGRRIRRLRNSLPLWLQLLAVLALCALLSGPRWIQPQSRQNVVVIFDATASMSAFRDAALAAAQKIITDSSPLAAETRWIFLQSDGVRLYSGPGTDIREMLKDWQPTRGQHDFSEALRLAEVLAGKSGSIVLITDHPPGEDALSGCHVVAVGRPLENAGFAGLKVAEDKWSALLRNYGRESRTVQWRERRGTTTSEWRSENLSPGQSTTLEGSFPQDAETRQLELADDGFSIDNVLPIIRPRPKTLRLATASNEKFLPLFQQITAAIPALSESLDFKDLLLTTYNPLAPAEATASAIIFVDDAAPTSQPMSGQVVTENHPLMENLNWQGLIAKSTLGMAFKPGDTALLWQDDKPLIFLRHSDAYQQLIFNFDVLHSNAERLPAFAILLHRFVENLRQQKIGYQANNYETAEVLSITGSPVRHAPALPGFFKIKDAQDQPLLDGAAYFADTREADFALAGTYDSGSPDVEITKERNSTGSFLDAIWALLAAALMITNWFVTGKHHSQLAVDPRGKMEPRTVK